MQLWHHFCQWPCIVLPLHLITILSSIECFWLISLSHGLIKDYLSFTVDIAALAKFLSNGQGCSVPLQGDISFRGDILMSTSFLSFIFLVLILVLYAQSAGHMILQAIINPSEILQERGKRMSLCFNTRLDVASNIQHD